jgi:DNA polymerase I-like protein with 3'-5' exonuclease and polymerase domains
MIYNPHTEQAYRLLHDGTLALQRAESNGFRIDVDYCIRKIHQLERKMVSLEEEFKETSFFKHWEHSTSGKVNINSPTQLSNYLYNIKKYKPAKFTETGKGSTDEEALDALNIPELKALAQKGKLKKCKDVLQGFMTEQVDGVLHPSYNLHLVVSHRSSCTSPNMQNTPKRDPEAMKIVRTAIIPPDGCQFMEVDFKGIEVAVNACYNKDTNLIKYVSDPTTDMHRDMAIQIFKLDSYDKAIHKGLRYMAKNGFVFPQFYGDYYKNCANNMACTQGQLPQGKWKAGQGIQLGDITLSDHLISKGIKSFDNFVDHIKEIEDDFWGNRFEEYTEWKDMWWKTYKKYGYFTTLTGFQCSGVMDKKMVCNYPSQGSAFHCLLKTFIDTDILITKEKLDSRLIGQIHDSEIICAYPDEVEYLKEKINKIVTEVLPNFWKWINVPLSVEYSIGSVNQPWSEKIDE